MRAVFLGRFQPLHQGHHHVIKNYMGRYDEFLVAVGSSEKEGERENPLSFEQRRNIIKACFPDLEVIGVEDDTADEEGNRRWVNKLVEKTRPDAVITQNKLVKRLVREYTDSELVEQEIYDGEVYSGTEIRRRIRSGEEWRYLVPDCAVDPISRYVDDIKRSGIKYEFKPGWKRENSYHDTYEK